MTRQPAPEEASAIGRTFARAIRDMFVALIAEGFTEAQAIALCGQAIAAAAIANGGQR